MTVLSRQALCSVQVCPRRSDPDFHRCIICGRDAVDHHHVKTKGMGGSKERDVAENIVMLCRQHHEEVTLHEWSDEIRDTVNGRYYLQIKERAAAAYRISASSDGTKVEPITGSSVVASFVPSPDAGHPPAAEGTGDDSEAAGARIDLAVTVPGPQQLETALRFHPRTSYEDWRETMAVLGRHSRCSQWWKGDAILFGDRFEGEGSQDWDLLDEPAIRIAVLASVCRAWPPHLRRRNLRFSHHEALAPLLRERPQEALEMAERAEREGWSVAELREELRGAVARPGRRHCPTCTCLGER